MSVAKSSRSRRGVGTLEALAVNDRRTALVVFLLGDPHLLEGGQRSENGTTDPDRVLALWGSDNLDLHGRGCEGGDFLLHTVGDTRVHGGSTRLCWVSSHSISVNLLTYHDNVAVQVFPDVDIALHDRVESGDVNATALETQDRRLEKSFRGAETLVANGDDLPIGKLVGLLQAGALAGGLDLLLEVESNVAKLLLDVTNDFALGGSGESVSTLCEDLHQVVGKIATSHIHTGDGVGKRETFVDGHNVSDTVTGVKHDTSSTTGSIQGQNSLDGHVERWGVECLENNLGHLLTVGLGVDRGLGEQDGVLLRSNTQLVVEGVVPNLLHVVPVGDNTVLDGVSQREDTTL
jgi:hypothetical protein